MWNYLKGRQLACRSVRPDLPLVDEAAGKSSEQAAVVKVRTLPSASGLRFLAQVEDLRGLLLFRYSPGTF